MTMQRTRDPRYLPMNLSLNARTLGTRTSPSPSPRPSPLRRGSPASRLFASPSALIVRTDWQRFSHEPCRRRREESHFWYGEGYQRLLRSSPTVQGFKARKAVAGNSLPEGVRRNETSAGMMASLILVRFRGARRAKTSGNSLLDALASQNVRRAIPSPARFDPRKGWEGPI